MSTHLRSQLADYGGYHREKQHPVGLEEIATLREKVRPVPVYTPPPRRWRHGLAVAVAAGILVLVALGVVPLLLSREGETNPANPVPTSIPASIPTTQSTPEVDETNPEEMIVPKVEENPEVDLDSIELPLITEVVTPSSIGDVTWRIYESNGEEQSFEVMTNLGATVRDAGHADQELDPSLAPDEIFVDEGSIVAQVSPSPLGAAGSSYLTRWNAWFDPFGTVLLANPDLSGNPHEGEESLLGFGEHGETIEVALYATEEEASLSRNKPSELTTGPVEIVARYRLDTSLQDDGTVLQVIDADAGQLIGRVTATIPLDWSPFDDDSGDGFYTVSDGEGVEQVSPDWDGGDFDAYVAAGDRILVYIESSQGGPYQIWETMDGRDWSNLGSPNGWPNGYAQPEVTYGDGMFLVDLNDQVGGRADNVLLTSPNGVDWAPIESLPSGSGRLIRVDSGLAWVGGEAVEVWTSSDGTTWDSIDLPVLPVPLGGLLGGGSSGNVVWFHQAEEIDRLWVLEFTGG